MRKTGLKKRLNIFLVLYLSLLTGCAGSAITVPLLPTNLDIEAKKFQPVSGKSVLYIFREYAFFGSAVRMTISLDGRIIGQLATDTYFVLTVNPGKHQVMTHGAIGGNISVLNIDAKVGNIYYVWQEFAAGEWGNNRLHLVDKKRGQEGVKASKRAAPITPYR